MKTLAFDMDNTLCKLYDVPNWLDYLHQEDTYPYDVAEPKVDPQRLCSILKRLQDKGYNLAIVSWLAKDSTKEYKDATRAAKRQWLDKHYPGVFNEQHLVQYGTTKRTTLRDKENAVLVDDDAKVRAGWSGYSIDATNGEQMLAELERLAA